MISFYSLWYLSWFGYAFLVGLGLGVFVPWVPLQILMLILFCMLFLVCEAAMCHLLRQDKE